MELRPARRLAFLGVCTRGTGQSIFDYADFALSLFPDIHVGPIICAGQNGKSDPIAIRILHQMRKRFGMHLIELPHWPPKPTQIDPLLVSTNTTDLYIQKYGTLDGVLSTAPGVRNLVHAVMDARHPHGDVYARNSASLPGCWRTSNQSAGGAQNCAPVVPHVVRPPEGGKDSSNDASDLRKELGIAPNATVFGRHGATFTFSLRFVRRAVIEIAHNRSDIVFLFLTTDPFCENYGDGPCPRNIIHLNASYDRLRFIRTCDAMLHGRRDGETFGLAVGEFGVHNKPVLTMNSSSSSYARAHVEALGSRGVYYWDRDSLLHAILSFNRTEVRSREWRTYGEFEPHAVMRTFRRVFLGSSE